MISAVVSRKPWAATIIALVFGPTLGMLYLGKGRNGLVYLVAEIVAYALPFAVAHFAIVNLDLEIVRGLLFIAVKAVGAPHCYVVSKKLQGKIPAVWFARWYSIIGIPIVAIFIALMGRNFAYEPFNMPSSSMKPTLLIGDTFFVTKFAYGYSRFSFDFFGWDLFPSHLGAEETRVLFDKPERGDVIVFKLPRDNKTDYIKRIVGLPGDSIQISSGVLIINGEAVKRERVDDFVETDSYGNSRRVARFMETLPNGRRYETLDLDFQGNLDNTNIYIVPKGHYFAMGDNRDNSLDSRVDAMGFIPVENLIGKIGTLLWNSRTQQFRILRDP